MPVADLLNRESSPGPLYEGIIVASVGSVSTQIEVIIPAYSSNLKWGPMPWNPRVNDAGATIYPSAGDRCLVALGEDEDPGTPTEWCVAWWPASYG